MWYLIFVFVLANGLDINRHHNIFIQQNVFQNHHMSAKSQAYGLGLNVLIDKIPFSTQALCNYCLLDPTSHNAIKLDLKKIKI